MSYHNRQPQRNTHKSSPAKFLGKSRLSLIGLILAITFPPAGLVISVAALVDIKKKHLSGKRQAILGIILSATLLILWLIFSWLLISTKEASTNEARFISKPFIAQIEQSGGKQICEDEGGGAVFGNPQPWYSVYYDIPDSKDLTSTIKAIADEFGYPLSEDKELIREIKDAAKDDSDFIYYDKFTFSPKNDYLISKKNGYTLNITINRDAPVSLFCDIDNYGEKRHIGNNEAILDITFELPYRDSE